MNRVHYLSNCVETFQQLIETWLTTPRVEVHFAGGRDDFAVMHMMLRAFGQMNHCFNQGNFSLCAHHLIL